MTEPTEINATWKELAVRYPIFVQWAVQRFGPLPDGKVQQADYERYRDAFVKIGDVRNA